MSDVQLSFQDMVGGVDAAANAMRSLSNPTRLLILCKLVEGPSRAGVLAQALNLGQAYTSQQLARLRTDGIVATRRDGRHVVYSLSDPRITLVLQALYEGYGPK